MYTIKVTGEFNGAHNLRGYEGKCENLHGHNWKVMVEVSNNRLDKLGMVVDFKKVKEALKVVLEQLDHKYLNDLHYFKRRNPTSENMSKFIFDSLKRKIKGLESVTVWETDTSSATYSETS